MGAAFAEPCSDAMPCEADLLCFHFNQKGDLCTKECQSAADCPPPSSGCNGMGWSGNGIYYGGSSPADSCTAWGGAFAGVRAAGAQKGGIASTTELVLWVR